MSNLDYTRETGSAKNWLITETVFDSRHLGKCEAIFCQGNGYLGVRNALEEAYIGETRNTFVTGTFNKFDEREVTELPNFPDVTEIDIWIDGQRFSLDCGEMEAYERTMNLYSGEVIRKVTWKAPSGKRFAFTFSRFVSLANDHAIGNKCEITALTEDAKIKLISGINSRMTNSGSQHFSDGVVRIYDEKYIESVNETTQSHVKAALYTKNELTVEEDTDVKKRPVILRRKVEYQYTFTLAKGKTATLEKISGIYTTRDLKYKDMTAEEAAEHLQADSREDFISWADNGYDALFAESKEAWKTFWEKEDIQIEGENEFDQLGVRFALYHLNIMVKKDDNRVGIGAKAMTGEGYKGHSFWDTEVFLFPYYLYTEPQVARTLLEYRYRNLYGARKKAKENGLIGAQYPWESAWIDDGEVTPLFGEVDVMTGEAMPILTGMIELHVTADVAFAVHQYYVATGDKDFMTKYGYEMIFDTARFWLSKMEWNEAKGQYEILDVIGPDEYKEHVNNNAYTNYLAHYNLKLAAKYMEELSAENAAKYEELRGQLDLDQLKADLAVKMDKLYLPQPNEDGIISQFDNYFNLKKLDLTKYKESSVVGTIYHDFNMEQINEYQVSKQGDVVVLLYLLEDLVDHSTKEKNYKYYEERTLHDSSLSKCTHGIIATDLGLDEDAYRFYQGSASIDLGPEMASSDAGIHSASMGGIWQSVVMGFGGVRLVGADLHISPRMPKEWKGLHFHLYWHGQKLLVNVENGTLSIENCGEAAVTVVIYGEHVTIGAKETVKKPCEK